MLNLWEIYKIKILVAIIVALICALVGSYLYSNTLKDEIDDLNISLNTTKSLLVVEKANNVTLKAALSSQNIEIEKNKIDLDEKKKELEEWKNKPPDIKYKTIEKIIKQGDSNECENIKNMLDDIRNTSF